MTQFTGRFMSPPDKKPVKIDVKDKKILVLLSRNSRTPLSKIATSVKLSRDSIKYRIDRLERLGVIKKYIPTMDFSKFGFQTFHILYLLDEKHPEKKKKFIDFLKSHPSVVSCFEYTDNWDLEVVMIARKAKDLGFELIKIMTEFSDVILEREVLGVINKYHNIFLPYKFFHAVKENVDELEINEQSIKLDKQDHEIVKKLSLDCRASTYKIAEGLSISADTVGLRLKKLVEAGIIKRFTVLIDLKKIGFHWFTFAIKVKKFTVKDKSKFLEFVAKHPNIISSRKTMGRWDFILCILAQDINNYHQTALDIKANFSDIVAGYDAWIGYKEHTYNPLPENLIKN